MRINLTGLFFENSGYGKMAREYAIALHNLGYEVGLHNIGRPIENLQASPKKMAALKQMKQGVYVNTPTVVLYMPESYKKYSKNYYNIGYCELETSKIPKHWVEQCNNMNEIWVPSNHMLDIAKQSGVKRDVFVMPHGIDVEEYKPGHGIEISGTEGLYKFLVNGEFILRKRIDMVIDAFCDAFTDKDPVCLIVKTFDFQDPHYKYTIKRAIARIKGPRTARIRLISSFIPDAWMPALYNEVDCVIHASSGEGWSFVPFETLACNKKLIMQPWGPTEEYIPKDLYRPIKYEMEDVPMQGIPNDRLFAGSQWARPSKTSLIKEMKYVYRHKDDEQVDTRRDMLKYDWSQSIMIMDKRLKEIETPVMTKVSAPISADIKPIMLCTSIGQRCGIATYTQYLYQALVNDVELGGKVGDIPRIVHIQFHYGLFMLSTLKMLLQEMSSRGHKLVITMHDFDSINPEPAKYNELVNFYADKIIVHSQLQKDSMAKCGMDVSKVEVIPHIINENLICEAKETKYDIGFFGFAYGHKGIIQLIHACRNTGRTALILANGGTNKEESSVMHNRINDLIFNFDIEKQIDFRVSFLEDDMIVQRLASCDRIFLPYRHYGNVGVSGAARVAMLAMRPMYLTDTPFFSDIDCAIKMPNNHIDTIEDYIQNPRPYDMGRHVSFIKASNYENIRRRHLECYQSLK